MNRPKLTVLLALLAYLFAPSAHADLALANAKGCLAGHELKAKKVGPAYLDVAKKYAGQKDANKTMGVTEAEARKLVGWILSLK